MSGNVQSGNREEILVGRLTDQFDEGTPTAFASFTPVSGGASVNLLTMPHAGNPTGPHRDNTTGPTDIVRADQRLASNIRRDYTVPTTIPGLWTYEVYDMLLEMAYGKVWSAGVAVTLADVTAVSAANTLTTAGGDYSAFAAEAPCPVWITRDGASPLDSLAILVDVTGTTLTFGTGAAGADFGIDVGDVASGDTVTIQHDGILTEDINCFYALIERAQLQVPLFHAGLGMTCNQFNLGMTNAADPTCDFQFVGRDLHPITATTHGTGTNDDAATWEPFTTGEDFQFFGLDGQFSSGLDPSVGTADYLFRSLDMSYAVGAIPVDVIGKTGPFSHSRGRFVPTGNFSLFIDEGGDIQTIADLADSDTQLSLFWANLQRLTLTTQNGYAFWFPANKLGAAPIVDGGNDSNTARDFSWMNQIDPRSGTIGGGTTIQGGFMNKLARFSAIGNN